MSELFVLNISANNPRNFSRFNIMGIMRGCRYFSGEQLKSAQGWLERAQRAGRQRVRICIEVTAFKVTVFKMTILLLLPLK